VLFLIIVISSCSINSTKKIFRNVFKIVLKFFKNTFNINKILN
jgi:hypothetical protein